MINKDMLKSDIEKAIAGKGYFIQIDYLERYLKTIPPITLKQFALTKLISIYEKLSMFNDAGKLSETLATNVIAFSEKIKQFVKATEFYIRAGQFNSADYSMKRAISEATITEKEEIYFTVKELYKKQAEIYERELKRRQAVKIYEKLLEMRISDLEKQNIKEKLMGLYEKLGLLKEYYVLKKALS
ncbi:MAG: hypothetical protein ISS01_02890 [Nanoarchaeota archaeon]|nr:hypothetical protein [Nanoarchaeota archaeon]